MERDPRLIRLFDLTQDDVILVKCLCGRATEFRAGYLQAKLRVASSTLVYDLQYRLRCTHCRRREGIEIAIWDGKLIGSSSNRTPATIIVPRPPLRAVD